MSTDKELLFAYGAEGGGSEVYRLPDGRVIEEGSSGGMLDEDEDPVISWKKEYAHWDAWWTHFTTREPEFWIAYYPISIHPAIRDGIRQAVDAYALDPEISETYRAEEEVWLQRKKEKWYHALDGTT